MSPTDFHKAVMAYCDATHAAVTSYGVTVRHTASIDGGNPSAPIDWMEVNVVYKTAHGASFRDVIAASYGLSRFDRGHYDHIRTL